MENKKNKKKLFAIIGASALAFILTVALSVSITLAYFGQAQKGDATISLGAAVTLDSATATAGSATVIPTQQFSVKATVAGPVSATDSVLFAIINVAGDEAFTTALGEVTIEGWELAGTAKATTGGTAAGNVYVLGTKAKVEQLGTTAALSKEFTLSGITPKTYTNEDVTEGKQITVNVTFIRVQVVYNSTAAEGKPAGTVIDTAASSYADALTELCKKLDTPLTITIA